MKVHRFFYRLTLVLPMVLLPVGHSIANPVCSLPQVIEPRASPPDGQPSRIQVDDFALALSWSPQHCSTIANPKQTKAHKHNSVDSSAKSGGQHAHQCEHNSFEWVVHGLWPQSQFGKGKKDQPRNCKGPLPALSSDLIKRHMCTLPGVRLIQDQWQKHGSCYWDTPEEYFTKTEEVFARYKLPPASAFAPLGEVLVSDLKAAIARANPGILKPENVVVFVSRTSNEQNSKNRLREIFICLNKQFQPMSCRTDGSTPDNVRIKVDPPKGVQSIQAVASANTSTSKAPSITTEQISGSDYCPRQQTKFSGYAKAVKTAFWGSLYSDGGRTIYCDALFEGRATQGGLPINIEHATPQSKLGGSSRAKADLHNLWPSIERVNSARGNYTLVDEIADENWAFSQASQAELKG
jgi:ribonuclease T2